MTATTNAKNLRKYKFKLALIVEPIQPFDPRSNMVKKVKKSFSKFQINYVTTFDVIKHFYLDSYTHFIAKL